MLFLPRLFWRRFLNTIGFGVRCEFCGKTDYDTTLSLYVGRGGIFKTVWLCAECNENPPWRRRQS